jgi:hypothetical protein
MISFTENEKSRTSVKLKIIPMARSKDVQRPISRRLKTLLA